MITVAIVGSGFGLYGLLPAFNILKHCKVVAICGKKTKRVLDYCNEIGLNNIYTDWELMIKEVKPDVIAIATSPDRQFDIASFAVKKGIHVFAEKPLTNTLKKSKLLSKLAAEHNVSTCMDFIFPEIAEWQKCKQLIDSKKFGKILNITVNWNFYSYDLKKKINSWKTDNKKGGGAMSFYCSHVLYYLKWFIGDFDIVFAIRNSSPESINRAESSLFINFRKNKLIGSVSMSCHAKGINEHKIVFQCEQGTIILENKNAVTDNFELWVTNKDHILTKIKCRKSIHKNAEDERVKYVKSIAKRFLQSIEENKNMIPNFMDGVIVQEQITKIQRDFFKHE